MLPAELAVPQRGDGPKGLKSLVAECHQKLGSEGTAEVVDSIKHVGFTFCTRSGATIAINDIKAPVEKAQLLEEADARIAEIDDQYAMGLITEQERYNASVVDLERDDGQGARRRSRTASTATAPST